jgi:hypothetical protein
MGKLAFGFQEVDCSYRQFPMGQSNFKVAAQQGAGVGEQARFCRLGKGTDGADSKDAEKETSQENTETT